jgi:hypothetical protein
MSVFLSRTFVALCFSGIALFIGGAWLTSEAMIDVGSVLLFASGVPLALFVPLLLVEAIQASRPAYERQPLRNSAIEDGSR